eukprot:10274450-Prorocentrum_lima.AAC.1
MAQSQFMLFRKAIGEKRNHQALVLTRKWWMQHYMKVQDLIKGDREHSPDQSISKAKGKTPYLRISEGYSGSISGRAVGVGRDEKSSRS